MDVNPVAAQPDGPAGESFAVPNRTRVQFTKEELGMIKANRGGKPYGEFFALSHESWFKGQ